MSTKKEHRGAQSLNRTSKSPKEFWNHFFSPLELVTLFAQKIPCGEITLQNPPVETFTAFHSSWKTTCSAKEEKIGDHGEKHTYQNMPDSNPVLCPATCPQTNLSGLQFSVGMCHQAARSAFSLHLLTNSQMTESTGCKIKINQPHLDPLLLSAYPPLSVIQFTSETHFFLCSGSKWKKDVKANRVPLIFIIPKKVCHKILKFSLFLIQHFAQCCFLLSTLLKMNTGKYLLS